MASGPLMRPSKAIGGTSEAQPPRSVAVVQRGGRLVVADIDHPGSTGTAKPAQSVRLRVGGARAAVGHGLCLYCRRRGGRAHGAVEPRSTRSAPLVPTESRKR